MKYKYKNLIPFVLIIFMAAAWYQIIRDSVNTTREYNGYVEAARKFSKDAVLLDAAENYNKAIQMKDSVGLRIELADLYKNNDMMDEASETAQAMITAFPQNAQAYEYLMNLYLFQESYGGCFRTYDRANKVGAVSDKMKQMISDIQYKYKVIASGFSEVSMYSNDICAVKIGDFWGFVNAAGENLSGAEYRTAGDFTGDKAFVENQEGEKYFIDSEGNKRGVLPDGVDPESVGNFQDGVYSVCDSGKYDFYTIDKQKVLGSYSDATTFANGYAVVLTDTGFGLIDAEGKAVGSADYLKVACDERGVATEKERIFFMKGDSWLMTSVDGSVVGTDTYEEVKPFYPNGAYAAVKKEGKWGFVDTEGKMCITPQFEDARSFSNGYAAVKKDHMWGFVDVSGNIVIEPVFQEAMDMNSSGNIFVKENGGWKLISLYQYNY